MWWWRSIVLEDTWVCHFCLLQKSNLSLPLYLSFPLSLSLYLYLSWRWRRVWASLAFAGVGPEVESLSLSVAMSSCLGEEASLYAHPRSAKWHFGNTWSKSESFQPLLSCPKPGRAFIPLHQRLLQGPPAWFTPMWTSSTGKSKRTRVRRRRRTTRRTRRQRRWLTTRTTRTTATCCQLCFFFNCHQLVWDVTDRDVFDFSNECVHLQYWLMLHARANINRSDDRESQTRVKHLPMM